MMINFVLGFEKDGKLWAMAWSMPKNNNLMGLYEFPNITTIMSASSRKQAELTADSWNDAYRKNGTYAG